MPDAPAVMIGLDFVDSVKSLPDADAGQLFKAALSYGADGSDDMELSPMAALLWGVLKRSIARDQKSYAEKCEKNRLAVEYREYKKKAGDSALVFKEWEEQVLSSDDHSISDDVPETSNAIQYNINQSNTNSIQCNSNFSAVQAAEPTMTNGQTTPTRTEIEQMYREKGYTFELERFISYNEGKGWKLPLAEALKKWAARERNTTQAVSESVPTKSTGSTVSVEEYERTKALLARMRASHE
ncbi:MAG: DUF6291 domain-containing protein [Oscillospiraceae bacterium]|nr:DUF6291 domain-containing protein [Oscillospiraceae bacterium]